MLDAFKLIHILFSLILICNVQLYDEFEFSAKMADLNSDHFSSEPVKTSTFSEVLVIPFQ